MRVVMYCVLLLWPNYTPPSRSALEVCIWASSCATPPRNSRSHQYVWLTRGKGRGRVRGLVRVGRCEPGFVGCEFHNLFTTNNNNNDLNITTYVGVFGEVCNRFPVRCVSQELVPLTHNLQGHVGISRWTCFSHFFSKPFKWFTPIVL